MKIDLSHSPTEFLEVAKHYLGNYEVQNCLIFSLLDQIRVDKYLFGDSPNFFVIQSEHEWGLAMQTPPHNLILSYPFSANLIQPLIASFAAKEFNIPGVTGENKLATEFAEQWCLTCEQEYKVVVHERIHQLTTVQQELLSLKASEQFVIALPADLDCILAWTYEMNAEIFTLERVGDKSEFYARHKGYLANAVNSGNFYLLKKENAIVTMACTPGQTIHGRRINKVFTPKHLRKNGYATSCVAQLSQKILNDGYAMCILFTDIANPVSNSIYQKIGYKPVIDVNFIKFMARH